MFAHLAPGANSRFIVPDLFFTECANVLRTRAKKGEFSEADALLKLTFVQNLSLTVVKSRDLLQDALRTALRYDLSAYDAVYVATSTHLQLPLITADDKLVRKLAGSTANVHSLGTLVLPAPPP